MKEYKTDNLTLASYLVALGFDFNRTEKKSGTVYQFVFDVDVEMSKAIEAFIVGVALINPVAYHRSLTALKSILFEAKKIDEATYGGGAIDVEAPDKTEE